MKTLIFTCLIITLSIFGCSEDDIPNPNIIPIIPPNNDDLGVWEEVASMSSSRKEIANATVQLNGKIYVMGGVARSGNISDLLEIYDKGNGVS